MQTKQMQGMINSEILQGIAKDLGKTSDKKGLRENNVFLSPKEGCQAFYMTSDEFSVEKRIVTTDPITVSIPISEFRSKIAALPNKEDISLVKEGNKLVLGWGRKGSKLRMSVGEELIPLIDIPEVSEWVEWKPGVVHKIYREFAEFCASPNEPIAISKPILSGIYFERDDSFEETYIRATDQSKAASMTSKLEWFSSSFSIPSSTLSALAEIIPSDVTLQIGVNEAGSLLVFKTSDTTVVTRVLTGEFPNIDRAYTLSPSNAETVYRLDLQDVMEVCIRTQKLNPTSRILKISLEDNQIFGYNADEDLGEFIGGSLEGQPEPIIVDADNLLAAARLFRGDEITLLVPKKHGPVTVLNEETAMVQALIAQFKI